MGSINLFPKKINWRRKIDQVKRKVKKRDFEIALIPKACVPASRRLEKAIRVLQLCYIFFLSEFRYCCIFSLARKKFEMKNGFGCFYLHPV
jgi:hypothetical protein